MEGKAASSELAGMSAEAVRTQGTHTAPAATWQALGLIQPTLSCFIITTHLMVLKSYKHIHYTNTRTMRTH